MKETHFSNGRAFLAEEAMKRFRENHPEGFKGSQGTFNEIIDMYKDDVIREHPLKFPFSYAGLCVCDAVFFCVELIALLADLVGKIVSGFSEDDE